MSAPSLFGLREIGLHSAYVSHVLPYLIVLGIGSGLSVAPSFSTGTLGLAPEDAGVGSAALNTAQQVGGSIGTALLNTLAASAATSYLVGRAHSSVTIQSAVLHGETTAFLWSAFAFIAGAIVAALVLPGAVASQRLSRNTRFLQPRLDRRHLSEPRSSKYRLPAAPVEREGYVPSLHGVTLRSGTVDGSGQGIHDGRGDRATESEVAFYKQSSPRGR